MFRKKDKPRIVDINPPTDKVFDTIEPKPIRLNEYNTTVVILTMHDSVYQFKRFQKCLKAIEEFAPNFNVVVVDNGSKLTVTRLALKDLNDTDWCDCILLSDNAGVAGGRNIGANYAFSDNILFLDDDQYLTKNWFKTVKKFTDENDVSAVGVVYREVDDKITGESYSFVGGGGLLVNREVFQAMKLDEQFHPAFWEDVDFSWRLHNAGCKIGVVPENLIEHEAHSTLDETRQGPFEELQNQLFDKWFKKEEVKEESECTEGLVSIVMPTYNYAHYIEEAIDSVLAQTYSNWELLIIDDASSDNTEEIVSQYDDPRIRYHKKEQNAGLSQARNTGFNLALGEYVCLLDPDDVYLPDKLERQVEFMKSHAGTMMCYGNYIDFDGVVHDRPQFNYDLLCQANFIPCQSIMFDATALSIVGGNDVSLPYAEDWDLNLRFAAICGSQAIRHVGGGPLYKLRIHDRQYSKPNANTVQKIRDCEMKVEKRGREYQRVLQKPVHVIHISPGLELQGGQIMMYNIIKSLDPRTFNTSVRYVVGGPLYEIVQEELPWVDIKQIPDMKMDLPRTRDSLRHLHYWGGEFLFAKTFAPKELGLNLIVTEHCEDISDYFYPGNRVVSVYDRCERNEPKGDYFPDRFSIDNGVEIFDKQQLADKEMVLKELGINTDKPIVCTVSKFVDIKGPLVFFDMMEELGKEYTYVFVGADDVCDFSKICYNRAERLRKAGYDLHLLKPMPHMNAMSVVNACDFFVLTSYTEGLPMALMEAMYLNKPCFASSVGGVSTLLDDAHSVAPVSGKEFAKRIKQGKLEPTELAFKNTQFAMAMYYAILYRTQALYIRLMEGM